MEEQNINWQYRGDNSTTQKNGPADFSWTASEFISHDRGAGWYGLLALSSVAVAGILYLMTKDRFTPLIIVLLGVTVGVFAAKKPRTVEYKITSSGLSTNGKLRRFNEFKSFSVVREGVIDSIMLIPLKRLAMPVSAYFEPKDEQKIVGLLGQYLPMEQTQLDGIERLSRTLRF